MVFPHLQINFLHQIQVQTHFQPFDTNTSDTIESHIPLRKINRFFPQFSLSDQIWALCYESGLCDEKGWGTESIIKKKPTLPKTSLLGKQIVKNLSKVIDKQQKLALKSISLSEKISVSPVVSLNLRTLFRLYFDLTHVNCLNYIQELEKKAVHVKEIYWIGSSVLKNIGKEAAIFLLFEILNENFSLEAIRRWFSEAPHLIKFFLEEENDLDFRVVFEGDDKDCSKELSLQVVRKIASMIKRHDIKLIEEKCSKLSNPPFHLYQDFSWSESYVLNSPLLSKRKTVHEPHLKFSIVALNTDTTPIDITVVGSVNGVLTLENPNLSSRNCFAFPMRQFMNSQKTKPIEVFTQQYGNQAFIDLILNCFRPSTYNLDGWRYFLRKCIRMGDRNDEIKMIDNLILTRECYLNQKNWNKASLDKSKGQSIPGYLYLVLEEYFIKVEMDCRDHKDPYGLSGFIFRACQSLTKASWINDRVIRELWHHVDQIYWNKYFRALNKTTVNGLIRKGLIDENVPFSVFSAKIGLLSWLMNPYSATIHCEEPHFYVTTDEFSYLMPIKIRQQCLLLKDYFSSHQIPESFMELFLLFGEKYPLSLKEFPLSLYHDELDIDLNGIKEISTQWLNHSSPFVKTLGMMLYLSFYRAIPDASHFFQMVSTLPSLVRNLNDQQKKEVLNTFDAILTAHSGIRSCLIENYFNSKEDQPYEWMEGLIQSHHPLLIEIGYSLWKADRNFLKDKKWHALNWNVFRALVPHHFNHSILLFQTLQKFCPITDIQAIDEMHLICSNHLQSDLMESDLRSLGKVYNQFLDKIDFIEFRDDSQKALLSFDLSQFIQKLFNSHFGDIGEDFLIRCSEKKLLSDDCQKLWLHRINQLVEKKSFQYAAAILALAHENKWLFIEKIDLETRHHLMMQLNQVLLNEQSKIFRSIVLKEFHNKEAHHENWLFHLIFSYFEKKYSADLKNDREILLLFIKIIPPEKMQQTSLLLLKCFQGSLADESILKENALIEFDELLIHEKMKKIVLSEGPQWKFSLLNFLQKTHSFNTQKRLENLWNIYLTILKIFKLDHSNQLSLYKQLVYLMDVSVKSSLPLQIEEWIRSKGKNIFEYLYHKNHLYEAQLFLIAVERLNLCSNHFNKDEILKVMWELSRNTSNKCCDSLIDYFCTQSFEKNFIYLKKIDSPNLRLIVERFFLSPHLNSDVDALKWLNLCLQHSIIEKASMNEQFNIRIEERITNVLESSKHCSEDLLLILHSIQSLKITNEQIWLMFWKKLEGKLNHQDHSICLKAWKVFKKIVNEEKGSFLNCWKHAFQCLTQIKSLELHGLIENPDWQQAFIKDATIHPLFYPTLTILFLGAAQLLDPDSFDETLIENILSQKKKFIHDHSFNKWNQMIEKALLDQFKSAKTSSGIKFFAELMASHLKHFSKNTKDVFYDLVARLTKSYVALNEIQREALENCDKYLSSIFNFIANSNLLLIDEKLNLIQLFGLKTHLSKNHIMNLLILDVSEKGHRKKISFLKPFFLPILSKMICQNDPPEKQIDHFFNLAVNKFTLSKKENENIHFLKFKASIDRLTGLIKNDTEIHKVVVLYAEIAPHLTSQEYSYQALELILPFVMEYAKGEVKEPEDRGKFISYLFRILNIPIKLQREEVPFKSISTSYYWKVLELLNQEKGLNFDLIDEALMFFLKNTIEMFREKELKHFEAISKIEPIMYFFSTVYLDESSLNLACYKKHFFNRKQIFAQAYLLKIFSQHRLNLFMLETWLNIKVDGYTFTDQEMSTKECQPIFYLIDLILINPSKQMTNILQAMELIIWLIEKIPAEDIDQLFSYYSKIFKSIFSLSGHSLSEADCILLYSFFVHGTDEKLIKKLKIKKDLKLGTFNQKIDLLFYNKALEALDHLINRKDLGSEQAFYTTWALKKTIEGYQFFKDGRKLQYIKNIKTLMPLVKKIAFLHEFKPLKYAQLQEYDFNKLINLFVISLIEYADFKECSQPIYVKSDFNDQRKEILLEWFRSLKSSEESLKKSLVCDALLITLITIISKKDGSDFWFSFNQPATMKEIREINEFIEDHGSISQKYCFLLVKLLYETKNKLTKKIEFFKQFDLIIEKLNSVSSLKESLVLFKIVSCFILSLEESFFTNNEVECKKILNKFLITFMECIWKNNSINIDKFQNTITFFIIKSFESNLLDLNDNNHSLFIKWTQAYINFKISEEPLIYLIFLICEQENRLNNDFERYVDDVERLIPHVNEYIIQTDTVTNFQKLIKLIKDVYKVNNEIGKQLFSTWYRSFEGLLSTNGNNEELLNIIFYLVDNFIKETNCELNLSELIIYKNELKAKQYICSEPKVFKKVFNEYFEEKRAVAIQPDYAFSNIIDLYHDR